MSSIMVSALITFSQVAVFVIMAYLAYVFLKAWFDQRL